MLSGNLQVHCYCKQENPSIHSYFIIIDMDQYRNPSSSIHCGRWSLAMGVSSSISIYVYVCINSTLVILFIIVASSVSQLKSEN